MDGTILGKKYNLMKHSEEGTQVIANPEGEATSELEKLQVGEGIYEIPQVPENLCKMKILEYKGTGTAQHSINLGVNAKYVCWFARKDSGIWTNSFILSQTQVRIIWRTPNSGENYDTISFVDGVLTITGLDAGQALNSEDVDYVIVYFE